MYYIYHIPGKKIGVTRNLNNRVTITQGYKPGEYEVLDQSDDINYISDKEIELQQSYGYRIDDKPYKNLIKMKINITEQTTTFPVPTNKLKGRLMDNIGMIWTTEFGKVNLDESLVRWIADNSHTSRYNSERSYVYNKALWEASNNINNPDVSKDNIKSKPNIFDSIRNWAKVRGIYDNGDARTQYIKLQEEAGELAKAMLKDDQAEFVDAIGDIVVVLTNLAEQRNVRIETCIASAYNQIQDRTGKMINGTFVKDE